MAVNESKNRTLELLLFRLNGSQRFGINVFKVKEILPCPKLTQLPGAHPSVCGITHLRGQTIPVLDLARAIGVGRLTPDENSFVIVTEFSRSTHGLLVNQVEKIINMAWEKVMPPPPGTGRSSYLTAITQVDDDLIEVIDVEKVLDEVTHVNTQVSAETLDQSSAIAGHNIEVLVVDDSSVARHQIKLALEQVGVTCHIVKDGKDALDFLKSFADEGVPITKRFQLIISDIEMPEMDGTTLCQEIRRDERLKDLYVLLHSSLSGSYNRDVVAEAGANEFIPKYNPDDLAQAVLKRAQPTS